MTALCFDIRALEPLLITRLEGDPNSSVSYSYVPGSVIRGMLANRYLPTAGFDLSGDVDGDGRRLFFDGHTRFLNAYSLDRLGDRALPVPLSWTHEKNVSVNEADASLYDFSVEPTTGLDQPKSLGESFCRLDGSQVELVRPARQINVHTARERMKGRATREEGAVYRYEALATGERFGGAILVAEPDDIGKLNKLLVEPDELWLGGSRSGGYGRVRIENVREESDWGEVKTGQRDLMRSEMLAITLLSDAILRTRDGAYADSLLPSLLPAPLTSALQLSASFKRVVATGGFNRRWGMPIPQTFALQMGSVFVFSVTQPISRSVLEDLEAKGIGERRVEGYGRVAVNWHAEHAVLAVQKVDEITSGQPSALLSERSQKLAEQMVGRLLRSQLDRLLAKTIYGYDLKSEWPSRAQLSRLRTIALNALPSCDVVRLLGFLQDDKLKAHAREQYQRARVGEARLLNWLAEVVLNGLSEADLAARVADEQGQKESKPDYHEPSIGGDKLLRLIQERMEKPLAIWQRIGAENVTLPKIGDTQAALTDELAKEYTIRLVEGLLHRAARGANQ